jgi:hypothetical protein
MYEQFTEPDRTRDPIPLITSPLAEGVYEVEVASIGQRGTFSGYSTAERVTATVAAAPDTPSGVTGGTI